MSLFDKFNNFFKYKENKKLYKKLAINYGFFMFIFLAILFFVKKSGEKISDFSPSPILKNIIKNSVKIKKNKLRVPKKISPPNFKMSSFLDSFGQT